MRVFKDRAEAGHALARVLGAMNVGEIVVYGLPRGGVVPAKIIADTLRAPLDLVIPRKIGHPDYPEYAIGAITEDGEMVLNQQEVQALSPEWLSSEKDRQITEAKRRRETYLKNRAPVPVEGKTAILVDDGIATGHTMEAAILSVRKRRPARVIVAIPVATERVCRYFEQLADDVVVIEAPITMHAVGEWYETFDQVSDEEVVRLLGAA